MQRDSFIPLKDIRERLAEIDARREQASRAGLVVDQTPRFWEELLVGAESTYVVVFTQLLGEEFGIEDFLAERRPPLLDLFKEPGRLWTDLEHTRTLYRPIASRIGLSPRALLLTEVDANLWRGLRDKIRTVEPKPAATTHAAAKGFKQRWKNRRRQALSEADAYLEWERDLQLRLVDPDAGDAPAGDASVLPFTKGENLETIDEVIGAVTAIKNPLPPDFFRTDVDFDVFARKRLDLDPLYQAAVLELARERTETLVRHDKEDNAPIRERLLGLLALRHAQIEVLQAEEELLADAAREFGASYRELGHVTGVTAQSAHRRWNKEARQKHSAYTRERYFRGAKQQPRRTSDRRK